MDREDVRVVEPGGDSDLAQEALRANCVGELGVEDLERERPVMPKILSQVNRGHTPAPELPLNLIAVGESFDERLRWCGHLAPEREGLRMCSTGVGYTSDRPERPETGPTPEPSALRCLLREARQSCAGIGGIGLELRIRIPPRVCDKAIGLERPGAVAPPLGNVAAIEVP